MELHYSQVLFRTLFVAASTESLKSYTILIIKLFKLKNIKKLKIMYLCFLSGIK